MRQGQSTGRGAESAPLMVIRRKPGRASTRGLLAFGHNVLACALGSASVTVRKREGDGATPVGRHRVVGGYRQGRFAGPGRCGAWIRRLPAGLGWCDDPADRNYNRPVRLPCRAGHETMARSDGLYDICIVLDWNARPRKRNAGSAIFLHLAAPGLSPTRGCVALTPADMCRLLPALRPGTRIRVLA